MTDDLTATHRQELRRGTVVLACLVRLRTPEYGYALLDRLGVDGFPVDANTLYPLLRRLEKQGLLTSEWDTSEARPRKFYRTSRDGERLAARLLDDWRQVDAAIAALAAGDDPRGGPPEHTDGSTEA
ncbi:PadR family transcriptional regulator [Nitriliruptoraceae bacterium ZYF776]|nr:PadR family transcriptional regulator [Profundirhabdus halotolerans]